MSSKAGALGLVAAHAVAVVAATGLSITATFYAGSVVVDEDPQPPLLRPLVAMLAAAAVANVWAWVKRRWVPASILSWLTVLPSGPLRIALAGAMLLAVAASVLATRELIERVDSVNRRLDR